MRALWRRLTCHILLVLFVSCYSIVVQSCAGGHAGQGVSDLMPMVTIPSVPFMMGSTPEEREDGYQLDETLHQSGVARQYRWFEAETRHELALPAYGIDHYLVTNAD